MFAIYYTILSNTEIKSISNIQCFNLAIQDITNSYINEIFLNKKIETIKLPRFLTKSEIIVYLKPHILILDFHINI